MLIMCICILAVDFKIFPRRYAKTETYGTSLMNVGVGAFVFANSFVSCRARGISTMGLRSALSSTSPLLFLGFARLVSTTGVDYQVHVGEYGVHWNFFFTLAGVAVLTSVIHVSPKYCGLVGSLVGDEVVLKSILNSTETVAKGWVRSLNPNDIVGGTEIGRGWCEVNVQVPTKRDEV